jgi:hypothetical protein
MIMEEFGQLLAQAFVLLAFVAEHDGPFEQGLLKFLRPPRQGRDSNARRSRPPRRHPMFRS